MRTNLVGYANNNELERDSEKHGVRSEEVGKGKRERKVDRFGLRFAVGAAQQLSAVFLAFFTATNCWQQVRISWTTTTITNCCDKHTTNA